MLYRINKSISIEGTAHSAGSFVDDAECPHILPCIESCLRIGSIAEATAGEVKQFTAATAAEVTAAPVAKTPLASKAKKAKAKS